eukprot:COSAG05_NODE_6995_length_869_cov_1.197403_1_plen_289_part_11
MADRRRLGKAFAVVSAAGRLSMSVSMHEPTIYLSRALCDYEPADDDEHADDLRFEAGEEIEVISDRLEDLGAGWSLGRIQRAYGGAVGQWLGFFPSSYAERMIETLSLSSDVQDSLNVAVRQVQAVYRGKMARNSLGSPRQQPAAGRQPEQPAGGADPPAGAPQLTPEKGTDREAGPVGVLGPAPGPEPEPEPLPADGATLASSELESDASDTDEEIRERAAWLQKEEEERSRATSAARTTAMMNHIINSDEDLLPLSPTALIEMVDAEVAAGDDGTAAGGETVVVQAV